MPKGTAAALKERMAKPLPRPKRATTNLQARGARPTVAAVGDARFPAGIKGGPPGGTDAFMRALLQLFLVVVVFIDERFSSSVRSGWLAPGDRPMRRRGALIAIADRALHYARWRVWMHACRTV